jgi:hypothetical protein
VRRGARGLGHFTVGGTAVEEDLGDFCSVWRDFDDVGVSAAGTTASQRAFSAHCVVARLYDMILGIAEVVECYPRAIEERKNTRRGSFEVVVEVGFLLDSKTYSVDDGKLPRRDLLVNATSHAITSTDATFFHPSAEP